MDPNYAVAHQRLGQAYLQRGQFEAALKELQIAVELSPESTEIQAALAHGYGVAGRDEEAKGLLRSLLELSAQKYVSAYDLATIYLGLGDIEQALAHLEKAYEERAGYVTFLGVDPRLDGLRTQPRFSALMKKMKFDKQARL